MKNIFLEKSCTKCGGETIPRGMGVSNYQNWVYLWNNSLYSLFLMYTNLKVIELY